MGGGRGCLETKQMVRRVNQFLRNQRGHMVKFVSKKTTSYYHVPVTVSDFCFRLSFGAGYRVCLGWQFA